MEAFTIERKINLPLEKVWMAMAEFNKSRDPEIKVVVEKEGDTNAGGAGTIRTLARGDVSVREIVDSVNPLDSITYRIIDNPFLEEYHGKINFKDERDATMIKWNVYFKPKDPSHGSFLSSLSKDFINAIIDSLEKQ